MAENLKTIKLEQGWFIDKDENNNGEQLGWDKKVSETAVEAFVPSIIQQFLPGHHGVAFYWCVFTPEIAADSTDRLILRFNGVDYKANVWLNGKYLGEHEGCEAPFTFDVTDILKLNKENLISVRVVNPIDEDIDGLNITNTPGRNKTIHRTSGSELNHGGIWYGVELSCVPAVHITDKFVSGDIENGMVNIQLEMNSTIEEETEACVEMNVYDRTAYTNKITGQVCDVTLKQGLNAEGFSFRIPEHKLWTPDEPNLYRIEITLSTAYGEHKISLNFGFKEFIVKDGFFYLNGKKFFPRSAHSGNAFPIGQHLPVADGHMYKDFIMAKASGFNMLRAIAGTFRPEQLDLCDEIGLLVLQECYAGWLLGVGPYPIGDEEAMLKRYDLCTGDMIKRDRNHTCIAMWGLLNETEDNSTFRRAVKFLPEARNLDPTRVILLGSGRFDCDFSIGSISNPYSYEWENQWGRDGFSREEMEKLFGEKPHLDWGSYFDAGDYHIYPVAPLNDEYEHKIRTLGHAEKPVFFSEYGTGALFHVIEEWRHFQQHGCDPALEDSDWVEYQSRRLMEDWKKFGLESVYPFPEMMLKESQRLNANVRLHDFNLIRSNPMVAGYSLTGLLDHGMCGEGLWSYWRRMKPEMYDAVSDGWAPLRFCLFTKQHVYAGEEFEIEAVMANDNTLKKGKYIADFAIMGKCGVLATYSDEFEIKDDAFAVPIMKRKVSFDAPTGKYELVASLREGGAPMGLKTEFYITNKEDMPKAQGKVYVRGLADGTVEFLNANGIETVEFEGQTDGIVLVGEKICANCVKNVVKAAESGAKVLFVSSKHFGNNKDDVALLGLASDIKCVEYRDWLYHKECVMTNNTVFDGLGYGLVDFPTFGQTFPHLAFEGETVPDEVICPAFLTGYHAVKDAYAAMHTICGFNKGEGKLYLNCFDIENNIGKNPAADILMLNFINYINK